MLCNVVKQAGEPVIYYSKNCSGYLSRVAVLFWSVSWLIWKPSQQHVRKAEIHLGWDSRPLQENMHTYSQLGVIRLSQYTNQHILGGRRTQGQHHKPHTNSNLSSGLNWGPCSCEVAPLPTTPLYLEIVNIAYIISLAVAF